MKQQPKRTTKVTTTNTFGALGYIFCCLQWFWALILYFNVIQSAAVFITPTVEEQAPQAPSFTFSLPGPLEMILIATVTFIMIAVTIYILIKMPAGIAKTSNQFVHKTTDTLVPIVIKAQHKKDSKTLRQKLTVKIIIVIKVLLTIIPLIITAASGLLEQQAISYTIALIVGGMLTSFSLLFFITQYILARVFQLKLSGLW